MSIQPRRLPAYPPKPHKTGNARIGYLGRDFYFDEHNTERSWRLYSRRCQHLIDQPEDPRRLSDVRKELEKEGMLANKAPIADAELVSRLEEAAERERLLQQRLAEEMKRFPPPPTPAKNRPLFGLIAACCVSILITSLVMVGGKAYLRNHNSAAIEALVKNQAHENRRRLHSLADDIMKIESLNRSKDNESLDDIQDD